MDIERRRGVASAESWWDRRSRWTFHPPLPWSFSHSVFEYSYSWSIQYQLWDGRWIRSQYRIGHAGRTERRVDATWTWTRTRESRSLTRLRAQNDRTISNPQQAQDPNNDINILIQQKQRQWMKNTEGRRERYDTPNRVEPNLNC